MARIFIISNRVSVPTDQAAPHAGGLEVALRALLKKNKCVWVGWSGQAVESVVVHDLTLQLLHRAGIEPKVANESANKPSSALRLVSAGFGVALVPRSMLLLETPGVAARDPIWLCCTKVSALSTAPGISCARASPTRHVPACCPLRPPPAKRAAISKPPRRRPARLIVTVMG